MNALFMLEDFLRIKGVTKYKLAQLSGMEPNYCYRLLSGRGANKLDKKKLVLFGMVLELTEKEINDMLKAGGFKELYSKDEWDGVIIWCMKNKKSIDEVEMELHANHLEPLRTFLL